MGLLRQELEESSRLEGYAAFERALDILKRETTALDQEVPEKARRHGVEFFLIDQVCDAGSAMAQVMGVPYVSVALALPREIEPGVPCWYSSLPFS